MVFNGNNIESQAREKQSNRNDRTQNWAHVEQPNRETAHTHTHIHMSQKLKEDKMREKQQGIS